jgi:hypothetical protein
MSLRCSLPISLPAAGTWALMVCVHVWSSNYTFRRRFYTHTAPVEPGLPASQNAYVFPRETFGQEFSSLS